MSHLTYINAYKSELLSKGLTANPVVMMDCTRQAYCYALIRLMKTQHIKRRERKAVMYYHLNRWNDIFPVRGPAVVLEVENFFRNLHVRLTTLGGTLSVAVSEGNTQDLPSGYDTVSTFSALIDKLYAEAVQHHATWLGGE